MRGVKRLSLVLLAAGVVIVGYSCGDGVEPEPPPPDPSGFLHVSVTLNQEDVGALVLSIFGDPLPDSIRGTSGLTVHHAPGTQRMRAFVAGPLPDSGTVLRFWTANANLLGRYSVRVDQAAGKDYEQLLPSVARARVTR